MGGEKIKWENMDRGTEGHDGREGERERDRVSDRERQRKQVRPK